MGAVDGIWWGTSIVRRHQEALVCIVFTEVALHGLVVMRRALRRLNTVAGLPACRVFSGAMKRWDGQCEQYAEQYEEGEERSYNMTVVVESKTV